jgi:hypothetical protein
MILLAPIGEILKRQMNTTLKLGGDSLLKEWRRIMLGWFWGVSCPAWKLLPRIYQENQNGNLLLQNLVQTIQPIEEV